MGSVEVVDGLAADPGPLSGRVFDDANRNSRFDEGEAGVPGVSVSNGSEVVQTDAEGRYSVQLQPLPAGFTGAPVPRGRAHR